MKLTSDIMSHKTHSTLKKSIFCLIYFKVVSQQFLQKSFDFMVHLSKTNQLYIHYTSKTEIFTANFFKREIGVVSCGSWVYVIKQSLTNETIVSFSFVCR